MFTSSAWELASSGISNLDSNWLNVQLNDDLSERNFFGL